MEEARAEFEASQRALDTAEEALREQAADNERLEGALESKTSEVAELGERHKEVAAEAHALQAETCRCDSLTMPGQSMWLPHELHVWVYPQHLTVCTNAA